MKKWVIYLFSILFLLFGFTSEVNPITSNHTNLTTSVGEIEMVSYSDWIRSHEYNATYGYPLFWFKIFKSKYPVNKLGEYQYDVYFISESYYPAESYHGEDPYICSTKLYGVTITADGVLMYNTLFESERFWCLFKGDIVNGIGDHRATFLYSGSSPDIYIKWESATPY